MSGSLYDIVAALQAMGKEMKALGDEATVTVKKVKEARSEEAGMTKQPGPASATLGAVTDLGNPRDAVEQGMRMIAAIEAAKRR